MNRFQKPDAGRSSPQPSATTKDTRWKLLGIAVCNVILAVGMALAIVSYARSSMAQKTAMKVDSFCTMVESMKQISGNYLREEKGYVDNWAAYISARHMTADEALDYIRTTNTQEDRVAHLVDMDDLSARSTYLRNGNPWVHCYDEMGKQDIESTRAFLRKMAEVFTADSDEVLVLGKYRVGEMQKTVVSVGTRVEIRLEDGTDKPYLLLRLIPVEYLQSTWVFPTEFPSAEISMIAQDGGYVVQSPSLRSRTLLEFIRSYNFPDDYNAIDTVAQQLLTTQSGLLEYKNSRGEDCYFYYSSFGGSSNIDILGYIPASELQGDTFEWHITLLVCGALLLLLVIDCGYILAVNRKLRRTVEIAEQASMAKTQFLSSMSHDIRTPMNAVIGMTEIAKLHLDDPAYVKDCLDKVSTSGNHLLTLVNDILDISKVESGKMTLNPTAFSLTETVEDISGIVRQSAAGKQIAFTVQTSDITQDIVVADPLRLRQILINLLTNAVKYTGTGGHVSFAVYQAPSDIAGHVSVHFVVADDGIGMSQEFQKTMYTSFSRATDSRINQIQGTGLGLAIVKELTEMMGGTIQCVSAPGEGSAFTVTLDLPTAPEMPKGAADSGNAVSQKVDLSGMRILVAEDNDLNWEIICAMLQEYGIFPDRTVNGQLCLDRLADPQAPRYDVIFMDVQMPVMDGQEAARRIRAAKTPYPRNIPIIAMTADAFAEDVAACLDAGMDAHISKPIDMKQVLQALYQVKRGTLRRNEEST